MWNRRVVKGGLSKVLPTAASLVAGFLVAGSASADSITLAWNSNSASDVTGYRVFVGLAPGAYTETFDVASSLTTFTYTGATNGVRYYFAVAAQAGDLTGVASAEVSTDKASPFGLPTEGSRVSPAPAVSSLSLEPPTTCRQDCVSVVGSSSGEISSLTALSNGALLYVEGGERVVMQSGDRRELVLQAGVNEQFVEAAVDPQFVSNGLAFVAVLRPRDSEAGELDVIRHRYVAGALGEPATVVPGLTVPEGRRAPIAVGDDGLLYVAEPANGSRRDAYASRVLVFDRDGATPRGNPSPVAAPGFDTPSKLVWDAPRKRAWLTSQESAATEGLKVIRRTAVDASLAGVDGRDAATTVAAVGSHVIQAIAVGPKNEGLVVATDREIIALALDGSAPRHVDLEAYGTPTAVAIGTGGERYVAVRRLPANGGDFILLKIADAPSRLVP
jgi:hypothetical protein